MQATKARDAFIARIEEGLEIPAPKAVKEPRAFSPSCSPPSNVLSNEVSSPADRPSRASSRPSSMVPEPIS